MLHQFQMFFFFYVRIRKVISACSSGFSVFVTDKNRPTRRLDYVISDNGLIAPVASFTREYAFLEGVIAHLQK